MKFGIASDFKVSFSSHFFAVSDKCLSASLRSAPINNFKRKRKKRKPFFKWKVSKKQVFQKKYYSPRRMEIFYETRRA